MVKSKIAATEKQIENTILEFLKYKPGVFAFKVNTMGVFDKSRGRYRSISKNIIPGTPDIIACFSVKSVGVFVGLEVKSEKGKQSKEQKSFQQKLQTRANGYYFTVRSIKEADEALESVKKTVSMRIACAYMNPLIGSDSDVDPNQSNPGLTLAKGSADGSPVDIQMPSDG
jgi:hypothetical protein